MHTSLETSNGSFLLSVWVEAVSPCCHDEIVLVQPVDLVSPPGYRHLTPFSQDGWMVILLLGNLADLVGEIKRFFKIAEFEFAD